MHEVQASPLTALWVNYMCILFKGLGFGIRTRGKYIRVSREGGHLHHWDGIKSGPGRPLFPTRLINGRMRQAKVRGCIERVDQGCRETTVIGIPDAPRKGVNLVTICRGTYICRPRPGGSPTFVSVFRVVVVVAAHRRSGCLRLMTQSWSSR